MADLIEMDEIGRGNEGYDGDNYDDNDDFNSSTEETKLITNDENVGADDIIISSTNKPGEGVGPIKIRVLDLELKELLKYLGLGDYKTTYIEKERFKVVKDKEVKKLFFKRENNDCIPFTKNNGKFYSKQTIQSKFGGIGKMEIILGIDDKDTKLNSKRAKVLNDMPSTSEIKNADEIELQSMTEKTIEPMHTIDTSFIDNDDDYGATNQFSEREMLALDRKIKRIDGVLKVAVAKKIELEDHIERENNKLKYIEGKSYEEAENIKDIKDAIIKKRNELNVCMYVFVCMPFYVVHYHNNLMKAHHYHKSHQIPSDSLEKMNIIILMFK